MASSVSVLLPIHVDANPTTNSSVGKNDRNTLNAIACATMLHRGNTRVNIPQTRPKGRLPNSPGIISVYPQDIRGRGASLMFGPPACGGGYGLFSADESALKTSAVLLNFLCRRETPP